MRIEVWSDVVCPWCYIGKRRLERAVDRVRRRGGGRLPVLRARPDRADSADGARLAEHLGRKYGRGARPSCSRSSWSTLAAEEGLVYRLVGGPAPTPSTPTGSCTSRSPEAGAAGRAQGGVCWRRTSPRPRNIGDHAILRRARRRPSAWPPTRSTRCWRRDRVRRRGGRPTSTRRGRTARPACRSSSSTGGTASPARSRSRCSARCSRDGRRAAGGHHRLTRGYPERCRPAPRARSWSGGAHDHPPRWCCHRHRPGPAAAAPDGHHQPGRRAGAVDLATGRPGHRGVVQPAERDRAGRHRPGAVARSGLGVSKNTVKAEVRLAGRAAWVKVPAGFEGDYLGVTDIVGTPQGDFWVAYGTGSGDYKTFLVRLDSSKQRWTKPVRLFRDQPDYTHSQPELGLAGTARWWSPRSVSRRPLRPATPCSAPPSRPRSRAGGGRRGSSAPTTPRRTPRTWRSTRRVTSSWPSSRATACPR